MTETRTAPGVTGRRRPYSADEQRVVAYLAQVMPEIGAGSDPIGFLIASHRALRLRLRELAAIQPPRREDSGR